MRRPKSPGSRTKSACASRDHRAPDEVDELPPGPRVPREARGQVHLPHRQDEAGRPRRRGSTRRSSSTTACRIRPTGATSCGIAKVPAERIEPYRWIGDTFANTYGKIFPERLSTPMGYFVFRKSERSDDAMRPPSRRSRPGPPRPGPVATPAPVSAAPGKPPSPLLTRGGRRADPRRDERARFARAARPNGSAARARARLRRRRRGRALRGRRRTHAPRWVVSSGRRAEASSVTAATPRRSAPPRCKGAAHPTSSAGGVTPPGRWSRGVAPVPEPAVFRVDTP